MPRNRVGANQTHDRDCIYEHDYDYAYAYAYVMKENTSQHQIPKDNTEYSIILYLTLFI